MKQFLVLILAFLFLALSWTDWVTDTKNAVVTIDNTAVLSKTRYKKSYSMKEYRAGKLRKFTIDLTDTNHVSILCNLYYDKKRLIANHDYIVAPYYHKGVKTENTPEGEVTEYWTFIRKDKYAIKLQRSLDYYHEQEIDSLKKELVMSSFDTIVLSKSQVTDIIKSDKRLRSHF